MKWAVIAACLCSRSACLTGHDEGTMTQAAQEEVLWVLHLHLPAFRARHPHRPLQVPVDVHHGGQPFGAGRHHPLKLPLDTALGFFGLS